jgi:hypothetical protein
VTEAPTQSRKSRRLTITAAVLIGATVGAAMTGLFWPRPAPVVLTNPANVGAVACRSAADQLDHVDWLWRQSTGEGIRVPAPDNFKQINAAVQAALPALKECRG